MAGTTPQRKEPPLRERALQAILRSPEDLAYPLVTDLKKRPVSIDIVSGEEIDWFQKLTGGALWLFAILFLFLGFIELSPVLVLIALAVICLVGLATWIAVERVRMAWHVTWDVDEVEVADWRWGRRSRWTAPYSDFWGVTIRNGHILRRGSSGEREPVAIQVVELFHENPLGTLILEVNDPSDKVEERARANAVAIGVEFRGVLR